MKSTTRCKVKVHTASYDKLMRAGYVHISSEQNLKEAKQKNGCGHEYVGAKTIIVKNPKEKSFPYEIWSISETTRKQAKYYFNTPTRQLGRVN